MSWYCNNLISKFVPLHKQTPKNNKSIWMNKLTLSKIKMKNRAYIPSVLEIERPIRLPNVC